MEFIEKSNTVIATFASKKEALDYIKKNSPFQMRGKGKNRWWCDKVGFCDFEWREGNPTEIHATSTYHPNLSKIQMFQNGLVF
jgi:hypothetical protein